MISLDGKIAVVTGANVGIGKETAAALAKLGAKVFVVCRDQHKGKAAVEEIRARTSRTDVELVHADFASLASTRAFGRELASRTDRVDILVNNAGLMLPTRHVTEDGFETMFATNHLGYFLTTHLLLPLTNIWEIWRNCTNLLKRRIRWELK